ncbi:MAG TPA: KH domain-containing protein [Bacillota bacterium]|nr:KH domain-containing protein [Clostridiales bacterium]HPT86109.1 KH domain-containing protein [Bacillota bacterium]
MADLKQVLNDIAEALVDRPDEVSIEEETEGDEVTLYLSVAAGDMGKVIGKNGRIAKAIRTVMKAAASASGRKVNVEIVDKE